MGSRVDSWYIFFYFSSAQQTSFRRSEFSSSTSNHVECFICGVISLFGWDCSLILRIHILRHRMSVGIYRDICFMIVLGFAKSLLSTIAQPVHMLQWCTSTHTHTFLTHSPWNGYFFDLTGYIKYVCEILMVAGWQHVRDNNCNNFSCHTNKNWRNVARSDICMLYRTYNFSVEVIQLFCVHNRLFRFLSHASFWSPPPPYLNSVPCSILKLPSLYSFHHLPRSSQHPPPRHLPMRGWGWFWPTRSESKPTTSRLETLPNVVRNSPIP